MHLGKLYKNFCIRQKSYSERANEIINNKNSLEEWRFNYKSEVLISDIWQNWCKFSRELYFSSCRGCTTKDNKKIHPISENLSRMWLSYLAKQAAYNKNVSPNGQNSFAIRKEPTWGDLEIFIKIITTVRPENHQTLSASYGCLSKIKHLQLVRNACAHKNIETLGEIRELTNHYDFERLKFASNLAWGISAQDQCYAIDVWLHEMNTIADLSTATI